MTQNDPTPPKSPKGGESRSMLMLGAGALALGLLGYGLGGQNSDIIAPAKAETPAAELTGADIARMVRVNPEAVVQALNSQNALSELIDQHLMDNPETILDSLDAYRSRMEAEANKPIGGDLAGAIVDTDTGHLLHIGGPADAPVKLVKFHDDNCGYCRRGIETVERLIAERDDVAVYVRPFPVLGQGSRAAAEVSAALAKQDKYLGYYKRLDDKDVKQLDRAGALRIAEDIGADMAQVRADMNSGAVSAGLTEDLELGREADVRGTPTFFVGNPEAGMKRVRGAIPYDAMVAEVAAALDRAETREE